VNAFLENPWIAPLIDWIDVWLVDQPVTPILLLAVEESGIPLPVPGDVIIAYTGYHVSQGLLPYPLALLLITCSILLGSSFLYWVSYKWGQMIVLRFGKFLHLHPQRLLTVEAKFRKYGPWVIIFGRHIPGFRIPITVFAGMSKVSYKTFILSTFISTIFWELFYLNLGIKLGPKVSVFLHTSSNFFLIATPIVIIIVGVFIFWKRGRNRSK